MELETWRMRPPLSLAPRTSCEDQSERWSDSDWLTYPKVTFLYGELTGGGGSTLLLSSRNVCLAQLTAAGNAPWLLNFKHVDMNILRAPLCLKCSIISGG